MPNPIERYSNTRTHTNKKAKAIWFFLQTVSYLILLCVSLWADRLLLNSFRFILLFYVLEYSGIFVRIDISINCWLWHVLHLISLTTNEKSKLFFIATDTSTFLHKKVNLTKKTFAKSSLNSKFTVSFN